MALRERELSEEEGDKPLIPSSTIVGWLKTVRDEVDLRYGFIIIMLCGCGCVGIVIRVFQMTTSSRMFGAAVWTDVVEHGSVNCLCGL